MRDMGEKREKKGTTLPFTIFDEHTVTHQGKRQSWSRQREIRVGTRKCEFHRIPKCRGFFYTGYFQGKKNRKFRPIFGRFFGFRWEWKKKIHGKNRLKKFRRKITDFSPKNRKIPTFSRKNPIFPEKIRFFPKFGINSILGH